MERVRESLNELAARHESFRTSFAMQGGSADAAHHRSGEYAAGSDGQHGGRSKRRR
ncbi:hypothetical protein [Paenibacillus rhizoplanae]|uniref:hypothetical protein n=1 Tax=Paenibacillus rhizoplanae TaxID=1917181 RepID=UPI003612CDA9